MKKISLFVVSLVLFNLFLPISLAKEKTLDQLNAEAQANRDAYNKAKNEKELTEAERNEATRQKQEVESQISSIQSQVKDIQNQIVTIQKDIEKKNAQMKDIMKFVQVTNGGNNYLEYIFGATDFTDFIYRISVAEQLGDYNENLVNEYNEDIKKLDEKQKELSNKQIELNSKQAQLSALEAKLNKQIESIQEGMLSKDDEYKTTISLINNLKKMGCSGNETLSQCQRRISPPVINGGSSGGSGVSITGSTYMPIYKGRVTSGYGQRDGEFHTGVDFSNGVHGDSVYPVAAGKVVNITYPRYAGACGNHIVYVYHNLSGRYYTTSYWHMTSVSVSIGQLVYPDTKLGSMGGLHSEDSCAYGTHVHLNLFNGLHTNNSGRINPSIMVSNIPSRGIYFTSAYGNRR